MQIVEVKNSIAKVFYNPAENNILPSDFILIDDSYQKVIAQVIDIETTENFKNTIAVLRLALYIDKDENLTYYNGYIPSKHSKLYYINPDEIIELIKDSEKNIYFGALSNHPQCFVKTGFSIIDENLFIQSDKSDKTAVVVKNLISELDKNNKKSILLDFNGQYNDLTDVVKLKISENLKLPLNISAFDTILENDVIDCPVQDRALIQSIILELREYLKTVKEQFISFNSFKQIVDNEFNSNPVSGLMLLRNKLWFYAQENIFADNKKQFDVIDNLFLKENTILIDASDISEKWYKLIINTVAELVNNNCYLFVSLNDVNIDKKSLVKLYNKKNITPVISTSYESSYANVLKSICHNQLLFKPSFYINEHDYYCSLVNKMNADEFILFGETTLYLPLLLELKLFDVNTAEKVLENDIKKDVDKFLSPQNSVISKVSSKEEPKIQENISEEEFLDSDFEFLDEIENADNNQEQFIVESSEEAVINEPVQNNATENISGGQSDLADKAEPDEDIVIINEANITENEFETDIAETSLEKNEINNSAETETDLSKTEEDLIHDEKINSEAEEAAELPQKEELSVNEEELNTNTDEEITSIDELIDKITESTTAKTEQDENVINENLLENTENTEESAKDAQKNKTPEVQEEIISRTVKEVPIYETHISPNDIAETMPFKIGDKVYHPKHGKGVIEGFANYSNKILFCQISFENVGRRILDPNISGLEKIS